MTTIALTYRLVAFSIGIYSATHQYSWGLRPTLPRPARHRHPELHAGADPDVSSFQHLVRRVDRPSDGSEIHPVATDELGQRRARSSRTCWIPGHHRRHCGHCRHDPAACAPTCSTRCRSNMSSLPAQRDLHPLRGLVKAIRCVMALNFFVADIGSILPSIISLGAEITAIVLSWKRPGRC